MSKPKFARSERDRALETINTRIGGLNIRIDRMREILEARINDRANLQMAAYILENTEVIDFPTGDPQ